METVGSDSRMGARVRERREKLGMSVRTLAAQAGFSPSFISQVENDQASPSIASLQKIAACLDCTLSEFFQSEELRPAAIVRANLRPRIETGWSKAHIENLGTATTAKLEPVVVTLRSGGTSGKHLHALAQEQFVLIISGEITLELDGSEHLLTRGDAVTLFANKPFRWINASGDIAQLLVVSIRTL